MTACMTYANGCPNPITYLDHFCLKFSAEPNMAGRPGHIKTSRRGEIPKISTTMREGGRGGACFPRQGEADSVEFGQIEIIRP